ncbi:Hypothetical predicted protein [Octopus vulgaris]|uniref:Uncharacterized protein n=1 Tax=Octopus vulgaris TaxID=6645 RepID=A0AA36B781_OCTVU|nr:Hypothetical predicted protein [Octopus vulgaris]
MFNKMCSLISGIVLARKTGNEANKLRKLKLLYHKYYVSSGIVRDIENIYWEKEFITPILPMIIEDVHARVSLERFSRVFDDAPLEYWWSIDY